MEAGQDAGVGTGTSVCCVDDGLGALPCEHARALVAELDRLDREHADRVLAGQLARVAEAGGPPALARRAAVGDEGAAYLLDAAVAVDAARSEPDQDGADPAEARPEAADWQSDLSPWAREQARVMARAAEQLGMTVDALATRPGGPDLAAALTELDLKGMERAALVEVAAAAKRVEAWAGSVAARAAAELSRQAWLFDHPDRSRGAVRLDPSSEELSMRLAVSRREAQQLLRVGRGLTRTFEDTAAALEEGEIDFRKAEAIVTTLDTAATPVAWMVEQDVLPEAARCTTPQLREKLQRRLVEVDPEDATERHARARADRHVTRVRTLADGMGSVTAVLAAEDAALVDQTLTAAATAARSGGDSRTHEQLRADALVALTHAGILTGSTGPHPAPETIPGLRDLEPECTGPACRPEQHVSPPVTDTDVHPDSGAHSGTSAEPPGPVASRDGHGHGRTRHGLTGSGRDPAAPRPAAEQEPLDRSVGAPSGRPPEHASDPTETRPSDLTQDPTVSLAASVGRAKKRRRTVQGTFPELGSGIPEVAVITPLLAALLRRGGERLHVVKPQVHVTVPIDLLLSAQARARQRDGVTGGTSPAGETGRTAPAASPGTTLPADAVDDTDQPAAVLSGYGAITAEQALDLAAECSTLQRLVNDPVTGAVLDVGRTRYRPPAALAEHVRLRDRTCTRPGCTMPADRCQLDHTSPWSADGVTADHNLGTECTRDHLLKTAGAFHVTQPEPGVFVWTTTTGHTYRRDLGGLITLVGIGPPRPVRQPRAGHPSKDQGPHADGADDPPPPF
ncbi:DUF222 domain-containing protein [Georgenia alba]|uniref:DUF222 domain-containing protein n=1 Tax=Georgenia alba TaxID=2233858 RepID=A0ABW2Q694_9MICO